MELELKIAERKPLHVEARNALPGMLYRVVKEATFNTSNDAQVALGYLERSKETPKCPACEDDMLKSGNGLAATYYCSNRNIGCKQKEHLTLAEVAQKCVLGATRWTWRRDDIVLRVSCGIVNLSRNENGTAVVTFVTSAECPDIMLERLPSSSTLTLTQP